MWKLAIDLGSSMTKIYRADTSSGILLAEPSCVAVGGEERQVKAIGKEAKSLIGKTAEYTSIIYPIYEGEIVNLPLATAMLTKFLSKIGIKAAALKRAQVVIGVPCGASQTLLTDYALLAEECGLKKVFFVEQPYLAVLGSGVVLSNSDPVFCMDIGGGITNVAVVSNDGIIAGVSMNIGGNNIDASIISRVARTYNLKIGALTAERLKNGACTLQNPRGTMVAEGSSVETSRPTAVSVHASELSDCVRMYIDKILEYSFAVLRKLPAEVSAIVNRNGVFLTGGVMKIPGVAEYIGRNLEMRHYICEEPQFAIVRGGGAVVREKELLIAFGKKMEDYQ